MEYYSAIEKNAHTTWLKNKDITKNGKKPNSRDHILHNSLYVTFFDDRGMEVERQVSAFQGLGMVLRRECEYNYKGIV